MRPAWSGLAEDGGLYPHWAAGGGEQQEPEGREGGRGGLWGMGREPRHPGPQRSPHPLAIPALLPRETMGQEKGKLGTLAVGLGLLSPMSCETGGGVHRGHYTLLHDRQLR